MKLTQDQISLFLDQGYVAVPGFFDPEETAALQADVERLQRHGFLRNVSTDGDGATHSQTAQNLQLCPCSPYSALMRSLPFERKVTDAVTALIGDEVALQLDQIFLKPPGTGRGTNWHQDNAYFRIKRPVRGVAMWIAIHDANAENGTLRLVPHAFREALEHQRDPFSDHHIFCRVDESEAELIELKAGGVVFFCYGAPHATGDNRSDKARAGLAYHFIHIEETDADFFAKRQAHPHPHLTGPEASYGEKEYGENLKDRFQGRVKELAAEAVRA